MNRLYEKLKSDDGFRYELKYSQANNCLMIVFHEYLGLEYFEGNYTSAGDEGYMTFANSGVGGHWHITCDEEALEYLLEFINEDDVYIENRSKSLLKWSDLQVMTREKFEKKKEKYMRKKSLRIYTVNSIIKRDGE